MKQLIIIDFNNAEVDGEVILLPTKEQLGILSLGAVIDLTDPHKPLSHINHLAH